MGTAILFTASNWLVDIFITLLAPESGRPFPWRLANFRSEIDYNKTFDAYVVTTNGFTLNHNKSLHIYFF